MYPRLSDMINDLFGTSINLPIQSYGFFLALAFLISALIMRNEFNRKERLGLIKSTTKKITIGKPATLLELIITFIITLGVGYKLTGIIIHYDKVVANPQEYVFSGEGCLLGGLILAIGVTFLQYYLKNKKKLAVPEVKEVIVPAKDQMWSVLFIAVFFGIIGAKIFHQFENWDDFMADPIGSLFSFSGLTFYGGLIVATFAVGYYGEKNGIPWRHMADSVAPPLIIAYGIGRIGCQIAGDGDWGIVNTLPQPEWLSFLPEWTWSYTYPNNIINEGVLIPGCTGPHCHELAEPVWPTPIYETTLSFLIFGILMFIRTRISVPGAVFAIYLMFNGLERFFIEKIRVNNKFDLFGINVTQAEVISTLLTITGLVLLIWLTYEYKKQNNSTETQTN